MKKLLATMLILLFALPAWATDYYVTQSGSGNGLTSSTPSNISDYQAENSPFDGDLSSDTVYFGGTITDDSATNVIPIHDAGMTVSGAFPGNPCTIDGNDAANVAIYADGKDNITITDFSILDMEYTGIRIDDSSSVTITNNTFTNPGAVDYNPIHIYESAATVDSDYTISGNTMTNCDPTAAHIFFECADTDGYFYTATITSNTITGNSVEEDGIRVRPELGAKTLGNLSYGFTVNSNSFTGIGRAIILELEGTAKNYCNNNTITDCAETNAIQLHYCTNLEVQGNYISGNFQIDGTRDGHGIEVDYSLAEGGGDPEDWPCNGVIIFRNYITGRTQRDYSAGIDLYCAKNCLVFNNVCVGNKNGIGLQHDNISVFNYFYNNTIANNSRYGARIIAGAGDEVPASTWINNIFYGNTIYGMYLSNTVVPTISYNCWYSNGSDRYDADTSATFSAGTGAVSSDPLFNNSSTDFRIQPSSPCKDAGTDKVNYGKLELSSADSGPSGVAPTIGSANDYITFGGSNDYVTFN